MSEEEKAREARIEFYGKDDARAFDTDEIWIMNNYAQSRESLLKEELGLLKISFEQKANLLTQADKYIQEREEEVERLKIEIHGCKKIISQYDSVDEYVRNHPSVKVGDSVSQVALKLLQELEQKNKEQSDRIQELNGVIERLIKQ